MNLFELFVKIGVDDQASGNLSKISSSLGKGLSTAAKIGTAAVGAAAAGITALTKEAVNSFAEYEQLAGGAQKIFDQMDYSKIAQDANNAYKELGLSANQYLAVINDVGATFAATMGDAAGYEAAKTGLKAISDYASGTGKNVNELSQKFTLITRSTSSYQSIADQFSGILPATSSGFLEQAKAAGFLSEKYKQLTEVPIAEYQDAVSKMLEKGVEDLGLANNTMDEAFSTLSGSLAMAKGAWSNLVTGLADDNADLDMLINNFVESVVAASKNIIPTIGKALNGIGSLINEVFPIALDYIPQIIAEFLPQISESAVGIVSSIGSAIIENLDQILDVGTDVIEYLKNGIIENMPTIVESASEIVNTLSQKIVELSGTLAEAAYELVDALGNELSEKIPGLSAVFENLETVVISLTAAFVAYKTATAISGIIDSLRKATEGQTIAQALLNAVMNANPFVLIATLVVGLAAAIITLWNTNEDFRNAVISAWEAIKETATSVFTAVANFFTETIPNAFQSMVDWIREGISSFISIGSDILTGIYNGIVGSIQNLYEAAKTIILTLAENIIGAENLEKIISLGADLINALSEGIGNVIDTLSSVGEDVVESIKSGISSAWNGLVSWFNSLWDSLFGNRTVNVNVNKTTSGVNGSFASGLSYVPFDGFIAELHRGERILTASEAREYNRAESANNTSGITIIQNIQAVPQTPVELAAATSAYFEQARWAF